MLEGIAGLGPELFFRRAQDQHIGLAPPRSSDKDLLRSGFEPCLLTVLRLSAYQKADKGAGRDLATALVRAGHLSRAVDVLRYGGRESEPDKYLVRLAQMVGEAGDLDGAWTLVGSLTNRALHDDALVTLIPVMARAGERERAVALAETVRYPHNWPRAWAGLAEAVADGGDFAAALGYAAKAEECAGDAELGRVLLTSMKIAHNAGDHVLAGTFADRVEDLVRQESRYGPGQRGLLVAVLAFEARNGDLERLDSVLRSLARAAATAAAEVTATAAESAAAAESDSQKPDNEADLQYLTILATPRPAFDPKLVSDLLDAVAATATDRDVDLALADRGEEFLRTGATGGTEFHVRQVVMSLLARHGHVERALALADEIVEPGLRTMGEVAIVEALARAGDTGRAETLARALPNRWARSRAVMAVVKELAERGETARAEALIPAIPDRWGRGEALIDVVRALAGQGELDRAEHLAHTILLGQTRARALAGLAERAAVPDPARARALAARAVFLGGWTMILEELDVIAPGGALAVADEVGGRR